MLVPPLPLPVNLRWRIDLAMSRGSATRSLRSAAGDLAEHQHGVVGRAQLLELGFPRQVVDDLVRDRVLRVLHRGVYAVGHRALADDGLRLAALLAVEEQGVLSHWSAAAVLGYAEDADHLHLTVTDGVHHDRPGLEVHRSRTLAAGDVTVLRRLAITRPARTLVDLAAVAAPRDALRAADIAMRKGCNPAVLRTVLLRLPGQPGRRLMAHYLDTRRAAALELRSELERLGAELVLGSDLPRPRFNALVAVEGGAFEVDMWWPDRRLVLELDGRRHHEGVVAELEDQRRDGLLGAVGQRVRRAAWWDVTREPGRLLSMLRRELR